MSVSVEKVAELLALPLEDRARLAQELILSLDGGAEGDAETEWEKVIDRRTQEIEQGVVDARSEEEMIGEIRSKLNATRRKAS